MALLVGLFLILALIGIPIAVAVGTAGVAYVYSYNAFPISTIVQRMCASLDSWPLLAIPFFILLGQIVMRGTLGTRLLGLCEDIVGHMYGGLAHVSILASMFFAGVSGSSVADAASIGAILIPEMDKKGYDTPFSVAINATSSTIGVIIPPSIPLVTFGWLTAVSVQQLFLGGVLPGVLVGLTLMAVTYVIARKRNYPRKARPTFKVFLKHLWQNLPALFMPVLILGSIMAGIMSTTESALAGVVYVLFIQIFVYKELKIKEIPSILCETARLTGSTVLVIATTSVVSHILTYAGVPAAFAKWVLSVTSSKLLIFIFMNIILLFMGTVMDMMPCLLIFQPIFYPIALQLGLSPVQFGVMMTINLAIGLFTPPVGQTLYISSLIGKITIDEGAKACIPFFIAMLAVLFLVIVFPPLTTLLPSLVMGV